MTERLPVDRGMSVIVKTVARWLRTPILVCGIYIVLYGHLGPGGGFAGGAVIATGLALRTIAYGDPTGGGAARARGVALASAGALLFLAAPTFRARLASATPHGARFLHSKSLLAGLLRRAALLHLARPRWPIAELH